MEKIQTMTLANEKCKKIASDTTWFLYPGLKRLSKVNGSL
jgi:hypothetical protein